LVGRLGF